jgi:amidase
VAVTAGFAPLAIGTETVGSVVTPVNRAALYALKFTVGSLPMDGVFGLSRTFDTLGIMAKSAGDLALLVRVLKQDDEEESAVPNDKLAIGFVDPTVWSLAPEMCAKIPEADEQMVRRSRVA